MFKHPSVKLAYSAVHCSCSIETTENNLGLKFILKLGKIKRIRIIAYFKKLKFKQRKGVIWRDHKYKIHMNTNRYFAFSGASTQ